MERYHRGEKHDDKHVFLNKINFRDQDGWHNHPYRWQFSVILSGMYVEEIIDTVTCIKSTRLRHRFNWIRFDRYHRITALSHEVGFEQVWTLFICGPKTGKSWGFWEPGIGHIHNTEYKRYDMNEHIMWNAKGWWFHDESEFEHGPYETREVCISNRDRYFKEYLSD